MPIRSSPLVRFKSNDTFSGSVATVPAGETWIVKEVRMSNGDSAAQTFNVSASSDSPVVTAQIANESVTAGGFSAHSLWLVLDVGDQVFFACGSQFASLWLSGARLVG